MSLLEKKAKEQVIREVSPVKLSSQTDLSCIKKEKVEEVVVSEVVEKDDVQVVEYFKPIKPSYSPDPSNHYYGNYDERKITFGTVLSLLFGNM